MAAVTVARTARTTDGDAVQHAVDDDVMQLMMYGLVRSGSLAQNFGGRPPASSAVVRSG